MDKSYKNKENIAQNGCISNMFRVKKCLFDQTSSKNKDLKSPNPGQQHNAGSPMLISSYFESNSLSINDIKRRRNNVESNNRESSPVQSQLQFLTESPMVLSPCIEDSPYSLFKVKKKSTLVQSKIAFCTTVSGSTPTTPTNKKCDEKVVIKKFLSESSPMVFSPSSSPSLSSPYADDSPFSLFKVKKKNTVVKSKIAFSAEYSAGGSIVTTPTNKKYTNDEKDVTKKEEIFACFQQSPNTVKLAVQRSICEPNLTGDFSKHCILPTIQGKHPDLKTVSPAVVASLLSGSVSLKFTLIDCRYPYEFEGGHIKDAENIYMKEDIVKRLTEATTSPEKRECKEVLIFYCEFSSERGPSMLRHLRNTDRDMNRDYYPFLYYPELYVMEGGYKAFFATFKDLCHPQEYRRMLDKDCADQLAFYKSKCKSSTRSFKRLKRTRSSLNF